MAALAIQAQSPPPKARATAAPKFEVASIRLGCAPRPDEAPNGNDTKGGPGSGRAMPGRLDVCGRLIELIHAAYLGLANGQLNYSSSVQISGGPAWIKTDRYQITAKAEGNPRQEIMMGPMLQALLVDRCKLKVHRATQEVPVYALTVAKSGLKLHPAKPGSCIPRTLPLTLLAPGQIYCGPTRFTKKGTDLTFDVHGVSLDEFSKMLDGVMDRPVVDKTGVAGKFDFGVEFAPDETIPTALRIFRRADSHDGPAATPSDPIGPSIFTALQEQLGLKLQPAKGPGVRLVIDNVERPSEN
jgi:uncharacterized protein (TIGR03435 family)